MLEGLASQIEEMDRKTVPIDDFHTKKQEIVQIRSELNQKTKIINRELLFFANNEVCPTCRQHIESHHKEKIVQEDTSSVDQYSTAIKKLDEKIKLIEDKITEIDHIHQESSFLEKRFLENTVKHDELDRQREAYKLTIEKIKAESYEVDFSKLEEVKQQLGELESILIEMSGDRTVMGYAAVLLKDSGIKAKIVKSFLPVINQLIQKYLAALDFFVEFHLDEEFNETILSRHRDSFSYESFSEGEKMRLNLGILFAWRAVAKLRGSIDCNLLVLDELLDSSLDADGTDDVLRVISSLTMDNNVFIISHKTDQISDKFSKVIAFEKVNSFSRIVE
jgi:DNA repair exonuclease SbcCD ATPase subunit